MTIMYYKYYYYVYYKYINISDICTIKLSSNMKLPCDTKNFSQIRILGFLKALKEREKS